MFPASCGGFNKAAILSGKVTYPTPAKPVTGGAIIVLPSDGRSLSAPIKWDGTFTIGEVPTGDMKVTIETESIMGLFGENLNSKPGGMKPPKATSRFQATPPTCPSMSRTPASKSMRKRLP